MLHTRNIMSHNRKGVSTILGTLIFIGILFSAYIPMTLVMKQADNIYEREIHEVRAQDELQSDENLAVYAYSKNGTEQLTIFVQNRGDEDVEIVAYWINDIRTEISRTITSSLLIELVTKQVEGNESIPLRIKVTTSNGNVFSSSLGSTVYSTLNGWYTPSLAISVTIINDSGQYKIDITNNTINYGNYTSQGTDHGDISKTFLVPPTFSLYNVVIEKKVGGGWTSLDVVSPVNVPALATNNPVVYVVVDGTQ